MATILEYHRSKKTIPDGEKEHDEFVQAHMDKWLETWPPDVREQIEAIVRENQERIYGRVEFAVKDGWDDQSLRELADVLSERGLKIQVEDKVDGSAFRVTVMEGDPEVAKQVVGA